MRQSDDRVGAVDQENRVIVHRRQAASHGPLFAARQPYVEGVVAPPAFSVFKTALFQWHGGISVNCQTSTLQLQPFMPVRNRLLRITIELKIALMHIHLNPRRLGVEHHVSALRRHRQRCIDG